MLLSNIKDSALSFCTSKFFSVYMKTLKKVDLLLTPERDYSLILTDNIQKNPFFPNLPSTPGPQRTKDVSQISHGKVVPYG